MLRRLVLCFFSLLFLWGFKTSPVLACDSCACTLVRCGLDTEKIEKNWFFDFTFEQQNWDAMDARDAHELHHNGHHVHNKTHEEFYRFSLGVNPTDRWSILADIPYVVRESIEVHNHRRLGEKEVSEGLGDLRLTATYHLYQKEHDFFGPLAGVKMPTGDTKVSNSDNVRFEPELQPGSGSWDTVLGAVFQKDTGFARLRGNALATLKTEGDQDFRYGHVFSSYLVLDRAMIPDPKGFQMRLGMDFNLQIEEKQKEAGVEVPDSGGTTLLLGPSVTLDAGSTFSFFGAFMLPVYQNLGGVHQELDFVWNAGVKASW